MRVVNRNSKEVLLRDHVDSVSVKGLSVHPPPLPGRLPGRQGRQGRWTWVTLLFGAPHSDLSDRGLRSKRRVPSFPCRRPPRSGKGPRGPCLESNECPRTEPSAVVLTEGVSFPKLEETQCLGRLSNYLRYPGKESF